MERNPSQGPKPVPAPVQLMRISGSPSSGQKYDYCQNEIQALCSDFLDNGSMLFGKRFGELLGYFNEKNELMIRCQGYIILAHSCLSAEFFKDVHEDFDVLCGILKSKAPNENTLLFFRALLALSVTSQKMNLTKISHLHCCIVDYLKLLNATIQGQRCNASLRSFPVELQKMAARVCARLVPGEDVIPSIEVDVRFLCIRSLRNLSAEPVILETPNYFMHTMEHVLESFVSLVLLPTFSSRPGTYEYGARYQFHVLSILQFLQFIENAVARSFHLRKSLFELSDRIFIKYIDRLLGFSINALFSGDCCDVQSFDDLKIDPVFMALTKIGWLHYQCIYRLLKLLTNSYRNTDRTLYPITPSLLEKLHILVVHNSYRYTYNKFELNLLSLELMVNFVEYNLVDRSQFAKLCLKTFNIAGDNYRMILVMIKILTAIINKILRLKTEIESLRIPSYKTYLRRNCHPGRVLDASTEHMEYTMICVYVSMWIAYFCNYKQSFLEYITEQIPRNMARLIFNILKKMRDFVPLMGYDDDHAFLMLQNAMSVYFAISRNAI